MGESFAAELDAIAAKSWRWATGLLVVYLAVTYALGSAHTHGKVADVLRQMDDGVKAVRDDPVGYRSSEAAGEEKPIPAEFIDATHRAAKGASIRNFGVDHTPAFYHAHHRAVHRAIDASTALTAEVGVFFDAFTAYAKGKGKPVPDLRESRRRQNAATWGRNVAQISLESAEWVGVLAFLAVAGAAVLSSWTVVLPKGSGLADHLRAVRGGMDPRSWRWTGAYLTSVCLLVTVIGQEPHVRDIFDVTGSQSFEPSSPALSRFVDRFSRDFHRESGPSTVDNSAVKYDSRSMYDHAKAIAASMPTGSTLLLLTGNTHAGDFEAWFAGDPDFVK